MIFMHGNLISKGINVNNKDAVKLTNQHKNLIRPPLIKVLEIPVVKLDFITQNVQDL
jgi:hypothetical protein